MAEIIEMAEMREMTEMWEMAEMREMDEMRETAKMREMAEIGDIAKMREMAEIADIAEMREMAEMREGWYERMLKQERWLRWERWLIWSNVHTDRKNSKWLLEDRLDEWEDGAAVVPDGNVRQVTEDDVKLFALLL